MNMDVLNVQLQLAIKTQLSENANIANFLIEELLIGKEAAYRRLRGEVPFTLYEVATISKKLGISLDYLIGISASSNLVFELRPQNYYNTKDVDYKTFDSFHNTVKTAAEQPYSEFAVSYNVFPQLPSQIFYLLSKYNSFKWMYQHQDMYSLKGFHEIDFPDSLYSLHRDTAYETMNIKYTSYIWDNTVFESIAKEIKYFSNIELINRADVDLLKKDLHKLLLFFEDIAAKGQFENGNKIDIYISEIDSDTAYGYLETEQMSLSLIGAFVHNFVSSREKAAAQRIKEKIQSLKRVSTLISGSGEIYRTAFFKKQHEIIDSI